MNKGATEIMKEIISNLNEGKVITSRELYNGYLSFLGSEDEKAGYHAAKRVIHISARKGILEPVMTGMKGKLKRANKWKKAKSNSEPEGTTGPVSSPIIAPAPDEVTDSQIGKSIIYYIEELKKSIHNVASTAEDEKQGLMKQIADLRATLKQATKELHDERLRSNNLQIALNRMRNVPQQHNSTKTFKMGEIAEIKR